MKEVTFIRRNIDKWRQAEKTIETASAQSPDRLADVYVDITSDLAFAQTHYPRSRITLYLNNLASALHNTLYRNKREKWSRILTFWHTEVPLAVYGARRELLCSFLVFAASVLIGVVSQLGDPEFVRLILGNEYVDMTLRTVRRFGITVRETEEGFEIAEGDPMAVYKGGDEGSMFLGITINNVRVSFLCFAAGLFTSVGTGWLLLTNGVMVGSFQAFFAQHSLLGESMLAVWLHGTLEISAIVIAGAAGIAMGNGWLFPGTYPRLASFRMAARRGMKIVMGTVPVFVVAGFIEGFLTRHTEAPDALRLLLIILSAVFIAYYYIYLPKKRIHEQRIA